MQIRVGVDSSKSTDISPFQIAGFCLNPKSPLFPLLVCVAKED